MTNQNTTLEQIPSVSQNLSSVNSDQKALLDRWQIVLDNIVEQTNKNNLPIDRVQLIAVSKTKPIDMVLTLANAGQKHFGENYLQEALNKITVAKQQGFNDIVWHYIGHIQRNKTRDLAQQFDWVHTLEREVIAKRLNDQRPEHLPKLNVLLQVNIDTEDSKSGCKPEEVDELVAKIMQFERLSLRGLMVIPAKATNDAFLRTKQLFEQIADKYPELTGWDTLSMGMTNDLEEAIKQGATMVRIGTAIFGSRQ